MAAIRSIAVFHGGDVHFRSGSKDDPCGRDQFESPTPSKNDAFGPEQVGGTNFTAPPRLFRTDSKSFEQFTTRSGPPWVRS